MAYQPEIVQYDAGIYQLEIIDPVDGGVGSVSNAPLLNLANRTAYLYQHVTNLENGTTIPPTVAPLNNANLTGTPTAPTPALGDSTTKISTTAFVQGTVNGLATINVAGGANVTLTAVQAGNGILVFTGALTANIAVIVPSSKTLIVENLTSGAFTLTVKTAAGTGVAITQGKTQEVFCDGTNVLLSSSDFVNMALTGTPTAPTAAPGTNTTQVSTTAFVAAAVAGVTAGFSTIAQVQAGSLNYAVDTGAVNALALAFTPALTAVPDGFPFTAKVKVTNTGSATVAINGLAAIPIVGLAHQSLQGGELVANGDARLVYNSSLGACVLLDSSGGATQVGNATQSQHAVAMGQLFGGLKGIQVFTSSGTFTAQYTGTHYFSGCAAGGGGAGGGGNNAGNSAGSGGGGGGAGQPIIRFAVNLVKGTSYAVTIPAGGAASAGAGQGVAVAPNGAAGGNTVFGTLITLAGGGGGVGGSGGVSTGTVAGGGPSTGFPGGGSGSDGSAQNASALNGWSGLGGNGGSSPFGGGGGGGRSGNSGGVNATSAGGFGGGGGGGGAAYNIGGGGGAGGAGSPGLLIIEW